VKQKPIPVLTSTGTWVSPEREGFKRRKNQPRSESFLPLWSSKTVEVNLLSGETRDYKDTNAKDEKPEKE
jgi:hypothetical protein